MKNYIKISSISLAILLGTSAGSFADNPEREGIANFGAPRLTELQVYQPKQEREIPSSDSQANAPSWTSTLGGYAWSGATNAAFYLGDKAVRYGLAYGVSRLSVEPLKEVTALGVYCGAYALGTVLVPGSGAIAGSAAYTATKTAFWACSYMPVASTVVNGAIMAAYAPVIRYGTDMAVDYAPTIASKAIEYAPAIASAGYSILSSGASLAQSGFSSLSQYWYGQAA